MLLREIRYMKYLDKQGIPPDGLELYARNEKLQVQINLPHHSTSTANYCSCLILVLLHWLPFSSTILKSIIDLLNQTGIWC